MFSVDNIEREVHSLDMNNAETLYMFEIFHAGRWSADLVGHQGADNVMPLEEAERQIPALARVLECSVAELRIVPWDGKTHDF